MDHGRDLLIDVSRAIWRRSTGRLPTGIDRICLAYMAHYRHRAQAVVQRGRQRLILSPASSTKLFDMLLDGGSKLRNRLIRSVPALLPELLRRERGGGRFYLNVGHTGLDQPGLENWARKMHARPVHLVHDLIPITHPEFARAGEAARHEHRMTTVLRSAAGIIANSQATLDSLTIWGASQDLPSPPAHVAWPGTAILPRDEGPSPIQGPFFLILGTIEGRKNHLMLLRLWRELVLNAAGSIPKLVVIGQRGWAAGASLAMLDSCPILADHVIEHNSCGDAALASYMSHARALLFPSFVEGYGMPLTEALAMGVPVIASDLPVFRELAGSIPDYCPAADQDAWRAAVLDYADPASERRAAQLVRACDYRAPGWPEHFDGVDRWLADLQHDHS